MTDPTKSLQWLQEHRGRFSLTMSPRSGYTAIVDLSTYSPVSFNGPDFESVMLWTIEAVAELQAHVAARSGLGAPTKEPGL